MSDENAPLKPKDGLNGRPATVLAPPLFSMRDNAGFLLFVMQRASYSAVLILEHKEIS